jgi:hypothetical protein
MVSMFVMACSSNAPNVSPSQPPTPPKESPVAEPFALAACPKSEEPAKPAPLRPARINPPRGLFGTDGLQARATPQQGKTCQAARSTLDAANTRILGAGAPKSAAAGRAWDGKSDPQRWGRIADRFGLDKRHRANLARDGFVVTSAVTYWSYVEAYHEIFQSQLPIYVSIDSVLHAIYASHEGVMHDVEAKLLLPRVTKLLADLHCGMATIAKTWPREIARDVDLYLSVARSLLDDKQPATPLVTGNDARAKALLAKIKEAKGFDEIELFGRNRIVDFGAFAPRGRYEQSVTEGYFRAMAWLSRVEFNLVSRSSRSSTMRPDASETPREVAVALALLELAKATDTLDDIAAVDDAWSELTGKREDVSFAELDQLRDRAKAGVSLTAQPALAAVIGNNYRRSIPTQAHPDGLTDLPVIAAMFGARVNADTAALAPIIQPAVPQRVAIGAADAAFLLGHDRAKAHLKADLGTFPNLEKQLPIARDTLDKRLTGDDMYATWLRAIRALAKPTAGALPSFMKSDPFADLRMSSAIAAYGQIRNSYQLMGGMAYLGAGCEIPDGYVEPAAETYDALIAYADRGKQIFARIDPQNTVSSQEYFTRLGTTLRVLRAIVATELAGQPLSAEQKKWLSMVVEIVMRDASGAPPTYSGWYFDLFRNFNDATSDPDLLVGIAQSSSTVHYLGAADPRIGVFVVDTGGPPRVVVGPVAQAYETDAPTSQGRLSRMDLDEGTKITKREPWSAAYTIAAGPPPMLDLSENWDQTGWVFEINAPAAVGPITLRLLDHHRMPIATQTKTIGSGKTLIRFADGYRQKVEMLHLQFGAYQAWSVRQMGGDSGFGFYYLPRDQNGGG